MWIHRCIFKWDAQVDHPKSKRLRNTSSCPRLQKRQSLVVVIHKLYIWTCCNLGRATFGQYQSIIPFFENHEGADDYLLVYFFEYAGCEMNSEIVPRFVDRENIFYCKLYGFVFREHIDLFMEFVPQKSYPEIQINCEGVFNSQSLPCLGGNFSWCSTEFCNFKNVIWHSDMKCYNYDSNSSRMWVEVNRQCAICMLPLMFNNIPEH